MRKPMHMIRLLLITLFLAGTHCVSAADIFWVGPNGGNWNDVNNWSGTSGGAGGARIPLGTDIAIFDASNTNSAQISTATNVGNVRITNGYTGTISQNADFTVAGFFEQNGGTFQGGTAPMRVNGVTMTLSGGQFVATSGTLSIRRGLTLNGGLFDANSGTVIFTLGGNFDGNATFHNLTFAPELGDVYVLTSTTTYTVNNTLTIDGGSNRFRIDAGRIDALGDVNISNTSTETQAVFGTNGDFNLHLVGTGNQTINGSTVDRGAPLGRLVINKPSGTLTLTNTITLSHGLEYITGTVVPGTSAADQVVFRRVGLISGNPVLHHVQFTSFGSGGLNNGIASGSKLTVLGNLLYTGNTNLNTNLAAGVDGEIDLHGDYRQETTNNNTGASAKVNFVGSANQAMIGTPAPNQGSVGAIEINKPSGTVTASRHLRLRGAITQIQGTFTQGTDPDDIISPNGFFTLGGVLDLFQLEINAQGIGRGVSLAPGSDVSVSGTLSFLGNARPVITGVPLKVSGNILLNSTFPTNNLENGTVILNGNANQTITSLVDAPQGMLPNIVIDKSGGEVLLEGNLYVNRQLTFTNGIINPQNLHQVFFNASASATGASDASYIAGAVTKTDASGFTFPTGKGGFYHPLTVNGSAASDEVKIEYFNEAQPFATTLASTLSNLSFCEYWSFDNSGTSEVTFTAGWNTNACNLPVNLADLRLTGFNGTTWTNLGNAGTTGDLNTGSITSSSATSSSIALTFAQDVNAPPFMGNFYWVGPEAGIWNDANHWSATSGGPGGLGIPGVSDVAIFDAGGNTAAQINSLVSVDGIMIETGYTNNITNTQPLTIGGAGFAQHDGTFSSTDAEVTVNGCFTSGGGIFQAPNSVLNLLGGFTVMNTGSFRAGNGTLLLSQTAPVTGVVELNNLLFNGLNGTDFSPMFAAGSSFLVRGDLTSVGGAAQFNGLIRIEGNVDYSGVSGTTSGTGILRFEGLNNQLLQGTTSAGVGKLPNIEINKSGGTLAFNGSINANRNWTYQAGTVDPSLASASIVFDNQTTVTGTHTLGHVVLDGGGNTNEISLPFGTTLTIAGTLTNTNGFKSIQGQGTIEALGNIDYSGTNQSAPANGNLIIAGSEDQQLIGSVLASSGPFPNLTINKPTGTLTLSNQVNVWGNWTYQAGNLIAGSGANDAVRFMENTAITGTFSLHQVVFDPTTIAANIDIVNVLTATGNVSLTNSGRINFNGGRVLALADITSDNSAPLTGGTTTFELAGTTNQTITSNAMAAEGMLPRIEVNKTAGDVLLANDFHVQSELKLTRGNIISTAGNQVIFRPSATVNGGADASHIEGPMRKIGGGCFLFPSGANGELHAMLVAGGSNTDEYNMQYFPVQQPFGSGLDTDLTALSTCEYWTLTRSDVTNNVMVGLGWNANSCNVTPDLAQMRVAGWDGTQWNDHGNGGTFGTFSSGQVNSSEIIPNFIAFTLANAQNADPLTTSWIGGVSDDWDNAANWTNGRPNRNRPAVIGDAAFTGPNQPRLITRNAVAKTLTLGMATTPVTLDVSLRKLKVLGDIFIGPQATLIAATSNLVIHGSWINNGGDFQEGEATVVFTGATAPQLITSEDFYDLTLKAQNGFDITIVGDLNVAKNVRINEGIINGADKRITVGKNWVNNGGDFNPESSEVVLTGAFDPLSRSSIQSEDFYNLTVDAPGQIIQPQAEASITVGNRFSIVQGTFNHRQDNANACIVEGLGDNNSLRMNAGTTLFVKRPTFGDKFLGFENFELDANSTMIYKDNQGPQEIDPSIPYGNLGLGGGTLKRLTGTTTVNGNLFNDANGNGNNNDLELLGNTLRIRGDLTLKGATLNEGPIELGGSWNSGKYTTTGSEVTFNGSKEQFIREPNLTFFYLFINNSGAGVTLEQPITLLSGIGLEQGSLNTDDTNLLTLAAGSGVDGSLTSQAFINGPVKKIGDTEFTVLLGAVDASNNRFAVEARISAPSAPNSEVIVEYRKETQTFGTALGEGVASINACEYFLLSSTRNTESIDLIVNWDEARCPVGDPNNLTGLVFDGTTWQPVADNQISFTRDPVTGINIGILGTIGTIGLPPNTGKTPFAIGATVPVDAAYAPVKKQLDGGHYIARNGKLMFKYEEQYNDPDSKLRYRILDRRYQIIRDETDLPIDIHQGINYLNLDISCAGLGLNRRHYILEVINDKEERFYLRFFQDKNFICGQSIGFQPQ